MEATEKLWNKQFPEESFKPDRKNIKAAEDFTSSFKYDIVSASKRQQSFFYQVSYGYSIFLSQENWCEFLFLFSILIIRSLFPQVSLPHYHDNKFLLNAITRYAMYLKLQQLHPDKFLVPCYDMDIVWHTHQVTYTTLF